MTVSSEYRGRIDEELKRLHRIADDLGTEPFLEFEDRYREGKLSEPYCLERLSRQYTFFNVSATYEPERSMELIDLAVEAWDESCIDISFTQLLDTKSYLLMDSGDYFGYRQYVLKRILSIVEPDCWDTDVSLTGLEAVIKEKRSFSAMGELCDFYRGSKRYHDQRRCLDMMEAWLEDGVESGNMHDLNLISAIDVLSKAEKDCFSHYFASIAKRTCYNLVDRNPKEYGCNGHIAFLIWKLSQYSGEYREDYLDHAIVNRDYDALEAKLNCYRYDCLDDYLKGLRFCLSSGYTPHDIIAAFNVNQHYLIETMDRSIEKELWSIGIHEEILTPHLRDLFLQGEYKALVKQVLEADNIDISIGHLLTTIFYNGLGTRSEVGIAARIWQEIEGWHGSRRLSEDLMQRMALAFDLRYDG